MHLTKRQIHGKIMESFFGVISRILDPDLYHIEVDVPGEDIKLRAFPKRGEVDEPRVGDVVLITEFDPLYHSFSLYEKIKENEFIGIRARGKKVWMNQDFVQIGIYPLDQNNDANIGVRDETSMTTNSEWYDGGGSWGGDDAKPGLDTKCTSWVKIDKEGNLDIFMEKTGHIHITEDHTVELDANCSVTIKGNCDVKVDGNVNAEVGGNLEAKVSGNTTIESSGNCDLRASGKCTIDSPDVKITGAKATIAGTPTPEGRGALCALPYCVFSGAPHSSTQSLGN